MWWGGLYIHQLTGSRPNQYSATSSFSRILFPWYIMSLEQRFQEAAEKAKTGMTKKPSDNELLELYGLFKQATVGDINISKPGGLDLKGRFKWESWEKRNGLSKEEAMEKYIALVENLVAKYA